MNITLTVQQLFWVLIVFLVVKFAGSALYAFLLLIVSTVIINFLFRSIDFTSMQFGTTDYILAVLSFLITSYLLYSKFGWMGILWSTLSVFIGGTITMFFKIN